MFFPWIYYVSPNDGGNLATWRKIGIKEAEQSFSLVV
jgi:hypothetical protein